MTSNISKLMMSNLMDAWCDSRLRCSSSRSVFKAPDSRFIDHSTLQITAADGSFTCSLSPSTVTLIVKGKPVAAVVNANSFGDNGVWVQVTSSTFWMELYVPTIAARGSVAAHGSVLPRA